MPIQAKWFRATLALGLIVIATAASAAERARPNILFLLSDDQRPDTIAALGNRHIKTPHLDRLVASGTAFTRAVCANPICTPSRGEILTGMSGFRTGVLDFGRKIDPGTPRFAASLRDAGYNTCYVGNGTTTAGPATMALPRRSVCSAAGAEIRGSQCG